MFRRIYNEMLKAGTIIIHRHTKPDGDALGSQIGLKEALISSFKNKKVFVVGDTSDKYSWMGEMDNVPDEEYKDALVIVVDCGAEKLINDERYKLAKKVIKIDHHIPQGTYGDIVYVDTNSESCASIIAELIFNTKLVMTEAAAAAIFTGIVTDSGRFRYSANKARIYNIVAKLMNYNIPTDSIYNKIYMEKLEMVKLRAELITKFKVTEEGVAYLINKKEDVEKYMDMYKVNIFDISRGMVNIMGGIENIPVWANFTEDGENGIYVEIRSNQYNINKVATMHNGGGHLQASGCTVYTYEEVEQIINELNEVVRENKC